MSPTIYRLLQLIDSRFERTYIVLQFQQIHICSRDDRIHIERYLLQLPFLSSAYSLTRQLTLLTRMTCTQIPKIEFRGFFRVRYFRLVDTTERICENQISRVKCDSTEMLVHLRALTTMNSPQLSYC